jgi:hypothetical protein
MKEFRDELGRAWTIHVSCSSLKRVAAHAGFDIADISNGKAIDLFGGSTTHLLDVLWPLVQADAESRGIGYDAFGDGIRGDAAAVATEAFKEELLSFFPTTRRNLLARLLERMEKIAAEAAIQAVKDIDNVRLNSVSGGTLPTSAPESLASTPEAGVCESL